MGAVKPKDAVTPAQEAARRRTAHRIVMTRHVAPRSARMIPTAAKMSGTPFALSRQPHYVRMAAATMGAEQQMPEAVAVQTEALTVMTKDAVMPCATTIRFVATPNGIKCALMQPPPQLHVTVNTHGVDQYTSGLARRKRARLSPWGESCFI